MDTKHDQNPLFRRCDREVLETRDFGMGNVVGRGKTAEEALKNAD